jgi:hypothetical protein
MSIMQLSKVAHGQVQLQVESLEMLQVEPENF